MLDVYNAALLFIDFCGKIESQFGIIDMSQYMTIVSLFICKVLILIIVAYIRANSQHSTYETCLRFNIKKLAFGYLENIIALLPFSGMHITKKYVNRLNIYIRQKIDESFA